MAHGPIPDKPEPSVEVLPLCNCGDGDCMHLAFDYPFCLARGCEEHHRAPVAESADEPCPVDEMFARLDREEGIDVTVVSDNGPAAELEPGGRTIIDHWRKLADSVPSAADVIKGMIATAEHLPRLKIESDGYTIPALPTPGRWQRFRSWLRSIPLYL
jgi:hypothetical protein